MIKIKAKCISIELQEYKLNYKYVLLVKTETSFFSDPKITLVKANTGTGKLSYKKTEDFLKDWSEIVRHE